MTTEQLLAEAAEATRAMRQLQDEITALGRDRRRIWGALYHDHGIPQRRIAHACGVNGQTVHNEIHRDKRKAG